MIRIVIAEPPEGPLCQEFQRAGVAVVGVGSTSFGAVQRCKELLPDVLVIDSCVAIDGGLPAVELLADAAPTVRSVVLGAFNRPEWLAAAEHYGVDAYVRRRCGFEDLLAAVHAVAAGHRLLTEDTVKLAKRTGEVLPEHCSLGLLTEPQREIVEALASGQTRREIAFDLGVAPHVVDTNLAAARRALSPAVTLTSIIAAVSGRVIDLRTPAYHSVDEIDLTEVTEEEEETVGA